MTNALPLILSLFAGACVGALFFEGLWRTVSRAVVNARPVRLFVLSFAVRATLLLVVLWLVSRDNAFRLVACMVGFLLGRTVILRIHRGGKEVAN
jgi:F1F0 ATPase subunit 2